MLKDIASTLCSILILLCHSSQPASAVLSESCILYLLACSKHLCTRCAQTIKEALVHVCSVRITVRVQAELIDKNKAQICCSERTSGIGIMLDHPLKFKLRQSYRPLSTCFQEINPAA